MNLKEFFQGTVEEKAARQTLNKLELRSSLNPRQLKQREHAKAVTRRGFLVRAATVGGGVLLVGAGVALLPRYNNESTANKEDHRLDLAKRLQEWNFPSGQQVSALFPEIHDYTKLLRAASLPDIRSPKPLKVYYADLPPNEASGMVDFNQKFHLDPQKDKDLKIEVTKSDGEKFSLPLITSTNPEIRLASSISGTNAELVILAKEVSQVQDFLKYCRRYRQTLEELGHRFTLINNVGASIDQDYIDLSIGVTQMDYEYTKTGKAWLLDFIDEGSFLRIGAILYANWARHFPNERAFMPKNYIDGGEGWAQPLRRDGVITLQGDYYRWAKGKAPDVLSQEFYLLWGAHGSR